MFIAAEFMEGKMILGASLKVNEWVWGGGIGFQTIDSTSCKLH